MASEPKTPKLWFYLKVWLGELWMGQAKVKYACQMHRITKTSSSLSTPWFEHHEHCTLRPERDLQVIWSKPPVLQMIILRNPKGLKRDITRVTEVVIGKDRIQTLVFRRLSTTPWPSALWMWALCNCVLEMGLNWLFPSDREKQDQKLAEQCHHLLEKINCLCLFSSLGMLYLLWRPGRICDSPWAACSLPQKPPNCCQHILNKSGQEPYGWI